MATAVMLDLETLSTKPNAMILTFGAVKFDPIAGVVNEKTGVDWHLSIDDQSQLNRHIDESTIEWWAKQDENVKNQIFSDVERIRLKEFTAKLNKYLVGVNDIWCQGPVFDITILENLFNQLQTPTPWNFWQIRDSRTLFGVHGDNRVKTKNQMHNALYDCINQAKGIVEIYQRFNIKKY